MVDATYIDNDRIQVINADDISFDTDRPSITLFPVSNWIIINSHPFTFPNFIQSKAYIRREQSGQTSCEQWSTIIWQEWGPDEIYRNEQYFPANPSGSTPGPTTRNIPRVLLGSVPAAANFLDIRVRLRRTDPSALMYNIEPIYMLPADNQWVTLNGGSCPVEVHTSLSRLINIVRIGNSIYLEIYQSTYNSNTALAPGGNPQANVGVNQSGVNSVMYRTTNNYGLADLAPYSNTELACLLDYKPYDTNGNKRPGGTNPCDGAFQDTSSTFSMDLIVAPGIRK